MMDVKWFLYLFIINFGMVLDLVVGIKSEGTNYHNGSPRKGCLEGPEKEKQFHRHDSSSALRQLRLAMTRVTLVQDKPLDGYIVTSHDEHQSQSVLGHYMRREYLTGFHGSVGEVLVTGNKAVLWTDGRYHIQANDQLDCNWILMKYGHQGVPTITEWLKEEFPNNSGARIGADPKVIPAHTWQVWERELAASSIHLVPIERNLIDEIWQVDRPFDNDFLAYELKEQWSGESWQHKVERVRSLMNESSADALVVTALDEIAWLLNIRGWDLPNTPVLRAYVILTNDAIYLYTDLRKIPRNVAVHLKTDGCFYKNCIRLIDYSEIWNNLLTMCQSWNNVWLPSPCGYSQGVSRQIYTSIPQQKRIFKSSPIIELRAIKNDIEIAGMRRAHIRDAVAMCDFLSDMEHQMNMDTYEWNELLVAEGLDRYRLLRDTNRGPSFPTIAGYGRHGAQPHYEPTNSTSIPIGKDSTLVIDSGGQYFDGTTDVTRTLHFGEPTEEQKNAYTLVLISSIQLASMVFPSNLRTDQLDVLAREPLWKFGYDYMHGTGHGIGSFLSVHESPISVSYIEDTTSLPGCSKILKRGNFLSNEPGYYIPDKFGVRLENILEVIETEVGDSNFLAFRDATLVPYEPKLINTDMLNRAHRRWLNNYNKRIRDEVGPELLKRFKMAAYEWMERKTRSIPEGGEVDINYFIGNSVVCSKSSPIFIIIIMIFLRMWNGQIIK